MPKASVSHSFFDIQITVRTQRRLSVFQVVSALYSVLPDLIETVLRECQKHWLEDDLGPRGSKGDLFGSELSCPDCSYPMATRKDWRDRSPVVQEVGEITVPQRRVKCCRCESVYKPYEGVLGLPKDQQHTAGVMFEAIQRALNQSYAKAARADEDGPCASTIHRWLNEWVPQTKGDGFETVVIDATQVPKWKEDGQITLGIAHEIGSGRTVYNRPTFDRSVVGCVAGAEEDLKPILEETSMERLVHDGGLNVDSLADFVVRCAWHVPYTVKHLLYRDDVSGDANKEAVNTLKDQVFAQDESIKERRQGLARWVNDYCVKAPQAATHVLEAIPGLLTYHRKSDQFEVQTTSPAEREMQEINKRFENGGGWTQPGAEAMLKHLQLWRHDNDQYKQQMRSNGGNCEPDLTLNSHK